MMLTINGLPPTTKYKDLKVLIKSRCKLTDFILDDLVSDNGLKKVRIGLADSNEGAHLVKCLAGYRMAGYTLSVTQVGKTQTAPQQNFDNQKSNFNQPRNDYNEPSQWSQPNQQNQWTPNSMPQQAPQQSFGYQHQQNAPMQNNPYMPLQQHQSAVPPQHQHHNQNQYQHSGHQPMQRSDVKQYPPLRPAPHSQSYGNMPESQAVPRAHALRTVEVVDAPLHGRGAPPARYPPQAFQGPDKPMTIMKDNFQGPSQYFINQGNSAPPQGHGQQNWVPQQHQQQPSSFNPRDYEKPNFNEPKRPLLKTQGPHQFRDYEKPREMRKSPFRKGSPGRPVRPQERISPGRIPGQRLSPGRMPGQRLSPRRMPGQRLSPGRMSGPGVSPGRMSGPGVSPGRMPGQRLSPGRMPGQRMSPGRMPGQRMSPGRMPGQRMSPGRMPGQRLSPGRMPGHRMSPGRAPGQRLSPGRMTGRRLSPGKPSGQRMSPERVPGRRISPGRRPSPERHGPPVNRRVSPGPRPHGGHEVERRSSPGRVPPSMEPAGGRAWPERRPSSPKRSLERRSSPTQRYSPPRHLLNKPESFPERAGTKPVRPPYDRDSQAPKQAMYSGAYRPNIHEKDQYPAPGQRPAEQRPPSWQQDRDKAMFNEAAKKREEDRNSSRIPFERPGLRVDKEQTRSHSPRKSRSPLRREKSSSRDRFKRHSPSPRSPRRSWALEKRRSPEVGDAPPPPIWPGQVNRPDKRPDFDDEPKRRPGWEYEKKVIDDRRPEDERRFPPQAGIRVRGDSGSLPPPQREPEFKREFPREDLKYDPREAFENKRPKFNPRDDFEKKDPKFVPRDEFHKDIPKYIPRDDFEKKGPKFHPREDFDKKHPVYDPRDDHSQKPRVGPRDGYDDKRPKFAPHEEFVKGSKFPPRDSYQDPKYVRDDSTKDPKFDHGFERPKFGHREEYDDRRDDFRKHDIPERKSWDGPSKPPPEAYKSDLGPKRDEPFRGAHPRREPPYKYAEEHDKQYEAVHERAKDFQKKVQDYHREDRRREYDRREPESKYEERPKHREDDRLDYRFDDRRKEDWHPDEHVKNKVIALAAMKARQEKAVAEISQKILDKHNIDADAESNRRLCLDLRISVRKIVHETFGDTDLSYIDLVLKFNAKYGGAREDRILKDVLSTFPPHFKPKLSAPDYSEGSAKNSRRSPVPMPSAEKRPYPSGGRPKPVRDDSGEIYEKERSSYHGPVKKPRWDPHPHQQPERKPVAKPAQVEAEPKVTKTPTVIEKKPVLNIPSKSVAEFPPLPQRKPVQKPKPEPKPATKPVKVVPEKQEAAKPATAKQPAPETKMEPPKSAEKEKPTEVTSKAESANQSESTEAPSDGHYELNALMSRALEDELQLIKNEVLIELSEAASPAERAVANYLKNVTGEHFVNVLGLNVTKRILQLHNPLYLKLQFSGKPESGCLQAFISEYNITAFKRIDSPTDTFAARVDSLTHFDRLCTAKEVKCGSAKVTVTPCYKFLMCPPALKTIYAGNDEEDNEENQTNTEKTNPEDKTAKASEQDKQNEVSNKVTEVKDKTKTQANTVKVANEGLEQDKENTIDAKAIEVKKDTSEPEATKVEAKNASPVETGKEASPVKINVTIEAHKNIKPDKNSDVKETKQKSKGTQNKTANKVTIKSNLVDKQKVDKIIEELMVVDELGVDDDDEEVTDQDILALMSSGIVLDECSGSDEDEK